MEWWLQGWDLRARISPWRSWSKHLCLAVTVLAGLGRTSLLIWSSTVWPKVGAGQHSLCPVYKGEGGCVQPTDTLLMPFSPSAPGVKEIDIAATLEHIRDQRPGMVQTKVLPKLGILSCPESPQHPGLGWHGPSWPLL